MRIPAIEALFPAPWTAAARRMLPSPSPQLTATAMWGPVLGWCALELLAESIDVENPERVALDLFDRLRLREPFAQAFTALGFEGEEGWRVAARIKVVLLTGAGVGKPEEAPAEPHPLLRLASRPSRRNRQRLRRKSTCPLGRSGASFCSRSQIPSSSRDSRSWHQFPKRAAAAEVFPPQTNAWRSRRRCGWIRMCAG